jgi:hypothetical protein
MDKEALIEKHREINVDHDYWYDYLYDDFIEDCAAQGIEVGTNTYSYGGHVRTYPDITWSGFWCQGDGLAFGGRVCDANKLLGSQMNNYPIFNKYINELGGYFRCSWRTGNNHWVHFNDYEIEDIGLYLEDDHPFAEIWQVELEQEVELIEEIIKDTVDSLCGDLYRKLERDYNELTSDEAVWETIVANDLVEEDEDENEVDGV